MKRVILTALVAVFLSLAISGCYTKLKKPEPSAGDINYGGSYYYNDDWDFYGYWSPYLYHYGWYSPYFYTYPSYYGYFYRPWYYDPWWWYNNGGGDNGRTPSGKQIRRGRGTGNDPMQVPGGSYNPPSAPSGGDRGYQAPPPSTPPSSGGAKPDNRNSNDDSSGKSTRRKR